MLVSEATAVLDEIDRDYNAIIEAKALMEETRALAMGLVALSCEGAGTKPFLRVHKKRIEAHRQRARERLQAIFYAD